MTQIFKLTLIAACLLAWPSMATAEPLGNLALAPEGWAEPLAEDEMSVRGGFNGFAFSVFFDGTVEALGDPAAMAPPDPNASAGDQAVLTASVGNLGDSSGIFQISQVPGSFNVVNNNMFIQIALISVLEGQSLPSLSAIFGALE